MDIANPKNDEREEGATIRIQCTFDSKIFQNTNSKYCIVRMKTADSSVPASARNNRFFPDHLIRFTAVGYEIPMTDAVELVLEGEWTTGKYGMQLQVDQWSEIIPETEQGVLNYLNSGLLKNIGSKTASEIVARFGVNSLRVIEHTPERLLEIRGITPERLEEIKESYAESRKLRGIITLLAPFKLTPKAALKIYNFFGPSSIDILRKSPYSLCQIPGYGFIRVDGIMQKNNCDLHDPMRVRGALHCALENAKSDGGHLFLEREKLIENALKLLNNNIILTPMKVKKNEVEEALQNMILEGALVSARENIYHPKVFAQEDEVAHVIASRLVERNPIDNYKTVLEQTKADLGLKLSYKQEVAVNEAFLRNLSVITGSPGTGKTTVLKMILEVYARLHPDHKVTLIASTGRASRRMAESTGFKGAKTMHNALGIISEEDEDNRDRERQLLDAKLIIVDECSMVDMWLARQFFTRLKEGAKIVLVGDPDQLPSVGAGNVFKEIITCGIVPVTVLDQIFRQSNDSFIAHNAKIINRGETNLYYGEDFTFIPVKNQEDAAALIMEIYCQEADIHGVERVQILSPFRHRGEASSEQINTELREIINPFRSAEDEIRIGNNCFRVGDRIMQNKNTANVSNGDLGFIRSVSTSDPVCAEVDFGEGRKFRYNAEDLSKLELSYATTIHKAMGSEYDVVIIPVLKAHMIMLCRNLLYTAITRAKKKVILVGQKAALFMAIHCNDITKRNTLLGERICLYYRAMAKSAGIPVPAALDEKLKKAG